MLEQSLHLTQNSKFAPPGWSSTKTQNSNRVELILVRVAHQPFGLLMSQVYNIVRPDVHGVKLLRRPDKNGGREWGEIEYRGAPLRVLELARMLHLPPVEPIERSQILLSGQIMPSGEIVQPFGIACDDIAAITSATLEDMRPVPGWLFQKRLGKLIWSAVLVARTILQEQHAMQGLGDNVLDSLQIEDSLSELGVIMPPVATVPITPTFSLNRYSSKAGELKREVKPGDERIPVMLLNLEILRQRILN